MPPTGRSSGTRIIDGFDHGSSRNGRAPYRGTQNLVIRARRRMEGLRRSGGDLGREGQGLGFHGASVSQLQCPMRWQQVLVDCEGVTKEPRTRNTRMKERSRKRKE
ncbi:hypothetical protein DEO72_LG1g2205 [Vigna unguiculata]|uniref:Uncharacterized protein n=1 Tax=Vigna unguiculata TaxID=3917 RepID=A0A4D6KTQ0_VIGUN|nr:hypothetical protein DEO72_LG1g2205 [Vigna unguiculata]